MHNTQPKSPSSGSFVVGLLAVFAVLALLLVWSPWSGDTPLAEPGASHPQEPSDQGPAVERVDRASAGDAATESGAERAGVPERTEAAARSSLFGAYEVPAGQRADEGRVALVPAPKRIGGGAMGVASLGMNMARIKAKQKAARAKAARSPNSRKLSAEERAARKADDDNQLLALIGRGQPVRTTPLRADGSFVFRDPPEGNYLVVLDHPILLNAGRVSAEVEHGEHQDLGLLPTQTGASLLVVVADARGEPVSDAKLELGRTLDIGQFADPSKLGDIQNLMPRMIPFTRRSDARGATRFRGLPIGDEWLLEVHADGLVSDHRKVQLHVGRETVVSVSMREGARVKATVLGIGAAPVPNLKLTVRCPDVALPERVKGMGELGKHRYSRTGRTAKDGIAHVHGLPSGRGIIEVRSPGYFALERAITLDPQKTAVVTLQLDAGLSISGRLVDEAGEPVADGRLLPTEPQGMSMPGMDTSKFMNEALGYRLYDDGIVCGDDGRFSIGGFRAGQFVNLAAAAPGFDLGLVEEVKAGSTDVVVSLREFASLRARVLSSVDNTPVTAFRVELQQRAFMMFDRTVRDADYDGRADGRFEFEEIPRDRFTVKVIADGFAPWMQKVDFRERVAGGLDLGDVLLGLPASIRGVTVDDDGRPIGGASVRVAKGGVADSMIMAQTMGSQTHTSDENGRFTIENLTGKRVRLIADREGYATARTKSIPVRAGECTEDVVVTLGRGGELLGRLVDEGGRPLSGWRAQATHVSGVSMQAGTTDAEGRFHFSGLMPGTIKVDCMPGDYMGRFGGQARKQAMSGGIDLAKTIGQVMRWTASDRVVVRSGEQSELELVFRSPDGAADEGLVRLRGTVRVGDRPLASGMVFLTEAGSTATGQVATIDEGVFTIPRVAPGRYQCRVQRGLLGGAVGDTRPVEVPALSGASAEHRVELTLPGGFLAGTVTDAKGQALVGVAVSLTRASTAAMTTTDRMDMGEGSALTDPGGAFRFEGLAPGRYFVTAREVLAGRPRSAHSAPLDLGAAGSRTGIRLTLDDGATLFVRVAEQGQPRTNGLVTLLDANGNPLALFHRQLTDGSGAVRFSGLPAGTFRVAVHAPGAAPELSDALVVGAGGEHSLDVEVARGSEATLRFSSKLDAPTEVPAHAMRFAVYRTQAQSTTFVTNGALRFPAATKPSAVSLPLGRLRPGNYRVRVDSAVFGTLVGTGEVSAANGTFTVGR